MKEIKTALSLQHWICFSTFFVPLTLFSQTPEDRRQYIAYQTDSNITIDGKMDEEAWELAAWSAPFVDIEGASKPKPKWNTQMKMLWDKNFLYIGVKMEEPHLWATYTERESIIFHENDIELFLDPDGDTHHYYELEINALGTEWDLMLTRPYKNGGKPIHGWNINGLQQAVHLEGTLNDPSDIDQYWSIEMAIPWSAIEEAGRNFLPKEGLQWRTNFSRVQWQLEVDENNQYRKVINPATQRPYPEDNWVWSPMGVVNMHLPERWGYLQFSEKMVGEGESLFQLSADETIKDNLRIIHELQQRYFRTHQKYAIDANALQVEASVLAALPDLEFEVSATRFKISAGSMEENSMRWYITEDSRIWRAGTRL